MKSPLLFLVINNASILHSIEVSCMNNIDFDVQKELKKKLEKLAKIFDFKKLLSTSTNQKSVSDYYRINKIPYTLFHTRRGFIHMGISRDHEYKEDDLLEQAKFVGKYMRETGAKKVLELATGRGANSLYLAKSFPEVQFIGLDLPNGHADSAKETTKLVNNFKVIEGDYHDLSVFDEGCFDLVFIIEALCHSQRKIEVFKQVKRVLRPGGLFIVCDGYHRYKPETLDSSALLASSLIAKGMMVEKFEYYGDFKSYAESVGFKLIFEEDVTKFILPTTERFEKLARSILKVPLIMKLLCKLLPSKLSNNVISGYLMPDIIKLNSAIYVITVFQS